MRLTAATITLLGLAILAGLAAQATAQVASVTIQNALIDARPYLLVCLQGAKIDTITNPGTLILIK